MSETNELTVLNNTELIKQGGIGVNLNSKFFQVKPATINVVQNNSTVGNKKGALRINETGHEFDEMYVTLLEAPSESRSYYSGNREDLNRNAENLLCFSRDLIRPDERARMPQAMTCASCPRQDWQPYRDAKANGVTGKQLSALIPPCDAHYYALFIDTVYKMPLQMYIRSKSKDPFDQGMANIGRLLAMEQAQGKNPNIFDVRFKLSTKLITSGNFKSYVLDISDVRKTTEEEREQFGAVYFQYVAYKERQQSAKVVADAEAEVSNTNASIESSLVESSPESKVLEGEYIQTNEDGSIRI